MPETSAGAISLDLTIQDKLTEQIERSISSARKYAESLGRELENSITAPIKRAADKVKTIDVPVSVKTEDIAGKLHETMENAKEALNIPVDVKAENVAQKVHDITEQAQTVITIPVDIEPESAFRAVEEKMSSIAESIREKLGAVDFPTASAERFTGQLEVMTEKLALMQKTWQELSAADPFGTATDRADKLEKKISDLESRLAKLSKGSKVTVPETKKVRTPAVTVPKTDTDKSSTSAVDVSSAMSGGIGGIAGMIGTAISGNPAIGSAVSSVASTITGTLSGAFKKLNGLIDKVTGNASVKLKKLIGNIVDITKPVRKLGETLKRAFKAVFLAAGAYAAFRALKDELLEAANADERFAKSLNEVKANLSIAFTPIIQHIMPMLDIFMEKLAVVSKQIAGFTAGLFGMTYKQAADATKKIKDITAAAKKAKLTVAGIDELNILSDNSEDEQGIDYSKLDMSEPELPDWAERLKASIRNGDWTGAGRALADKVNEVLGSVDWNKAEQKVKEKVKHLADLINGFTDELDPRGIGDSIAGTLNTVTGAITTFADDIDWGRIGRKLAQGLNRAIHKIKWRQLGKALTSGIRILTDVLYDFSEEFDFQKLGEGLSKALNGAVDNIDTAKIGKTLSNIIKGAITTATSFLEGTDFNKIGEKIGDFLENIDFENILKGGAALVRKIFDSLLDVAEGLLDNTDWADIGLSIGRGLGGATEEGIKDSKIGEKGFGDGLLDKLIRVFLKLKFTLVELAAAIGVGIFWGICDGIVGELEKIGNWIDENISTPFIDGIKEKFGIKNDSSSKTKSIGASLMTGIKNGASDDTLISVKKAHAQTARRFNIIECDFTVSADMIVKYVEEYIEANDQIKPIVIVDYLQIISAPEGERMDDRERIDDAVKKLKLLSKENKLFVLVISNMARSSYREKIGEDSFKESGLIEYTCDYLFGLQLSVLEDETFFTKKGSHGGEKETLKSEKQKKIDEASEAIPKEVVFKAMKNRNGRKVFRAFFNYRPNFDLFEVDNNSKYDKDSPKSQFSQATSDDDIPFEDV